MKAILVVNVPVLDDGRHLCNECPIWNKEHSFCEYDFNMEAKGCPLKPLPDGVTEEETGAYVKGFMDALVSEVDDESNISG